jgi:predicted O-methyltransferase YrrM
LTSLTALRSRLIALGLRGLGRLYCQKLRAHPNLVHLLEDMDRARDHAVASRADMLSLYESAIERAPKKVLELGPGHSTAVIALALERNGDPHSSVVAVEEAEAWLEQHRKVIPVSLHHRIRFCHSATEARDYNGVRAARYVHIPGDRYDFVHVDGPAHLELGAAITADVIDLLPSLARRCLVVFDGREASARFARPHLEAEGFKTTRHPFTLSYHFRRD